MKLTIEVEQEENGRYLAEIVQKPGVMAYGKTPLQATGKALALLEEEEVSEQRWDELFTMSPEALDKLGNEADEEYRQGKTQSIDNLLFQVSELLQAH